MRGKSGIEKGKIVLYYAPSCLVEQFRTHVWDKVGGEGRGERSFGSVFLGGGGP